MSFSKQVKEELSKLNNLTNKEELKYEFFGYLSSDNITEQNGYIKYSTENDYNIDRFSKIIRNIGIEDFDINVNGKIFCVEFSNQIKENRIDEEILKNRSLLQAFMRGLFMGAGSINNPESKYHLECGIRKKENIINIVQLMKENGINMKQRENTIYIKEGEEISKFLAFIGAVKSVLKFEEIRVERHMNNKVNRLVNCKTANLNKVLNASVEQVEAIRKLKQSGKFEKLDETLKEIAEVRLQNPDMPLVELGQKLSNPIGKSGVNYRLKKIIKISQT
jgi:DNA-binding protein WhiA